LKRLILASILCAAAAAGQCMLSSDGSPVPGCILPGEPYPNAYPNVKAYLALTDGQVQQLNQLRTSYYQSQQAIYDQINQKQQALDQLLNSGSQDTAAAGALVIAMANLRRQVTAGDGPYRDSALAILTTPQKTKLGDLENARKLQTTVWEATSLGLLEGGPYRILPAAPNTALPAETK
jgi:Spy/CpxP family protein refolding chaperone